MKQEILSFTNKISLRLSKLDRKFTADITYGMLASGNCLLRDIVDQLHEDTKKVNSVERLTRHLNKDIPKEALHSYLHTIHKWIPEEPAIHIVTAMLLNWMATSLKHLVLSGMVPKAAKTKMSTKKVTM